MKVEKEGNGNNREIGGKEGERKKGSMREREREQDRNGGDVKIRLSQTRFRSSYIF